MSDSSRLTMSANNARKLFLGAQGLLDDPARRNGGSVASVGAMIERLGFVQLDTINVIERAHHLILSSRADAYKPKVLDTLLTVQRRVFEHWTHDASIIPTKWFAHWRPRFERYRQNSWHARQMGKDADQLVSAVLDRVRREGPMMSRHFEHNGKKGASAWWGWKPHKVALEYLWRIGEFHVVSREGFQKVYDLTERAAPEHYAAPAPSEAEHIDWACRTALDRLGVASAREIADFWRAVRVVPVTTWLRDATSRGEVIPVMVESSDDSAPRPGFAFANVRKRIARLPDDPPDRTRLLCPFDPVLRDRERAKRRFNFDYRFEGFVPQAKRKHGYYVMPIMERDRFIGRVDPKFHRDRGELELKSIWWETGLKVNRARRKQFEAAVERLANFVGARTIRMPKRELPL